MGAGLGDDQFPVGVRLPAPEHSCENAAATVLKCAHDRAIEDEAGAEARRYQNKTDDDAPPEHTCRDAPLSAVV